MPTLMEALQIQCRAQVPGQAGTFNEDLYAALRSINGGVGDNLSGLVAQARGLPYILLNGLTGAARASLSSILADGSTVANYRQGVGQTNDGAGLCSVWANQIGIAPNLTAALTRRPTIQGDGSLLFNGSSNLMKSGAFTLNQPETIYIVYKVISWVVNQYIVDGNLATTGAVYMAGTTPTIAISAGAPTAGNTNNSVGIDHLNTVVFNGASSSLQVDGTTATTGNAGALNMGGITLGGAGNTSSFTNIQVRELVVRNAITKQAQIRALLKTIYGTP